MYFTIDDVHQCSHIHTLHKGNVGMVTSERDNAWLAFRTLCYTCSSRQTMACRAWANQDGTSLQIRTSWDRTLRHTFHFRPDSLYLNGAYLHGYSFIIFGLFMELIDQSRYWQNKWGSSVSKHLSLLMGAICLPGLPLAGVYPITNGKPSVSLHTTDACQLQIVCNRSLQLHTWKHLHQDRLTHRLVNARKTQIEP